MSTDSKAENVDRFYGRKLPLYLHTLSTGYMEHGYEYSALLYYPPI